MKARSLRLRLLLGAAIWIALANIVFGVAITQIFTAIVNQDELEDLEANLTLLVSQIDFSAHPLTVAAVPSDPRYELPVGGLYWQVQDLQTGDVIRSPSLWDFQLPAPATKAVHTLVEMAGPAGRPLLAVTREIISQNADRSVRINVAEDREIRDEQVRGFTWAIVGALGLLWLALSAASFLQIWIGLGPLRRLRRDVENISAGGASLLSTQFPNEVLPVVQEFNSLLAGRERAAEFARTRAADLAHSLKTPLAVVATTSEKLRKRGETESADVLKLLSREMADRIDYHLRLARLRVRIGSSQLRASLDTALLRSVSVLRRSNQGEHLFWQLDLANEVWVNIDQHDLMELVGILLENAANWADTRVDVHASMEDGQAQFSVVDDGPGLTDEQIEAIGVRGRRLDELHSGTGLGLSIAKEIVALNFGTLTLSRAEPHGLCATVTLPQAGVSPDLSATDLRP